MTTSMLPVANILVGSTISIVKPGTPTPKSKSTPIGQEKHEVA